MPLAFSYHKNKRKQYLTFVQGDHCKIGKITTKIDWLLYYRHNFSH